MDPVFLEIVEAVRKIKREDLDQTLNDAEIAALQCAWDSIGYKEYVENKEFFTSQYNCYLNPKRSKTVTTITSCGSRLFSALSAHFDTTLNRNNFKRKIVDLLDFDKTLDSQNLEGPIVTLDNALEAPKTDFLLTQDIQQVFELIQSNKPIVSIFGASGMGKTTLLEYISENVEFKVLYTDLSYINSFTQWAYELLAQARIKFNGEDETLTSELFDLLNSENVLILIDSITYLNQDLKGFIEAFAHRSFKSQSKIVLCSQKKNIVKLSPGVHHQYQLQGLSNDKEIKSYFKTLNLQNPKYWPKIAAFYGGNFREIDYCAQFILTFFQGDVGAYWDDGTRVISPATVDEFTKVEFTQLDIKIFSMFSGEGEHVISQTMRKALMSDTKSRSSEWFARMNYFGGAGLLN